MLSQNMAYQLLFWTAVLLLPATQACDRSALLVNTTASNQMATIEPNSTGRNSHMIHFEGGVVTEEHMETKFSGFSVSFQDCQVNMACEIVDVISNSSVLVSECNSTLPPVPMMLDSVDVEKCNGSDGDFYVDSNIININATVTDDAGCDRLNMIWLSSQEIEQCSLTNGSVCDDYCINPGMFVVTNETKKKLEDFCECLSVQGVDCVNEENSDVCTSFCEVTSGFDQRPSCDVFEDGFDGDVMCTSVCTNLTSQCNAATFSNEGCAEQCRAPRDQGTLCWYQFNTGCKELIFGGLFPHLCAQEDLTRDEVNTIVNDYITFVLGVIRDFSPIHKVDIFQAFLFLGVGCDRGVTATADKAFIKLISCGIDDLLSDRTSDLFPEVPMGVLKIVEDVSELLSLRILQRNGNEAFIVKENLYLQAEKIDLEAANNSYTVQINKTKYPAFAGVEILIPLDSLAVYDNGSRGDVVATVVITRTLASYLNAETDPGNTTTSDYLVTVFLARRNQISGVYEVVKKFSEENPVEMVFPLEDLKDGRSKYECVSWDVKNSTWSQENVTTDEDSLEAAILCQITHFTSFSMLVSPTGVVGEDTKEKNALEIVTYLGCAVSITCLLLTMMAFVLFRKLMNKGPLLYIHFNLALSLLLLLVLFVTAVEPARPLYELCLVVTALLHYFILSAFCWMLSEGIMLYLMVVRVFGRAVERWYWFLLLGWGLPLPIVVLSAGVLEGAVDSQNYTNPDYCWLNGAPGAAAIWTFLVPMGIIVIINSIILAMTVTNMVKGRKHGGAEVGVTRKQLTKTAIKSTIILLPLMGVTWVIGIFAVNHHTTVFAWFFTIFNTLQGTLFFILHVLRNDAIKKKFSANMNKLGKLPQLFTSSEGKKRNLTSENSSAFLMRSRSTSNTSTSDDIKKLPLPKHDSE